jgi:hypothetical protein
MRRASRSRKRRFTRRLLGVEELERDDERDDEHDEQQPPARRGAHISSGVRDRRARSRAPVPPPDPSEWLRSRSNALRGH